MKLVAIAVIHIPITACKLLNFVVEKIKSRMKNRITIAVLLTVSVSIFSSCSKAQNSSTIMKDTSGDKVLIVYLSRTKNTKAVAQIINGFIGGKLVELQLQNPYPEDYHANVEQVVRENETGFLPPLKTKIDSIKNYNVVFIGFPTWDMKIPPPVKSFLKQYDLSGKTVVPFNTNAGYGVGSGFQTVKELCPGSSVLEGYETKGGIEKEGVLFVMEGNKKKKVETELKKWLQRLKMIE